MVEGTGFAEGLCKVVGFSNMDEGCALSVAVGPGAYDGLINEGILLVGIPVDGLLMVDGFLKLELGVSIGACRDVGSFGGVKNDATDEG